MPRLIALLLLIFATGARTEDVVFERVFVAANGHPKRRIEVFYARPSESRPPLPLILYVHGYQDDDLGGFTVAPQQMLREVRAGYVIAAISQPGFGASDGPPDFCGPKTQRSVRQVLDYFRAQPWIDPQRIALVGISRGATVASLVALQDHALKALVLSAGMYDLRKALVNRRYPGIIEKIHQEIEPEPTTAEVRERSAILAPGTITAETLILHGKKDDRASPWQDAAALARRINTSGGKAELKLYADRDHFVAGFEDAVIQAFLKKELKPAAPRARE